MGGPKEKKGTKRGQTNDGLVDAPEDLPQNDMAPALKPKRRRIAVRFFICSSTQLNGCS